MPDEIKTVTARIAVEIDNKGEWLAYGYSANNDRKNRQWVRAETGGDVRHIVWVTATLPLPVDPKVTGTVSPDEPAT